MSISAPPIPPSPTDTESVFNSRAAAWVQWQYSSVDGFNAAAAAAAEATAAGNYKGLWSSLTGALAIPASVSHSGKLWMLTENVANVTTVTPGVSAVWIQVPDVATLADIYAGTEGKIFAANHLYSAAAPVTLTDAATITPNFHAGRNFKVTLGGNRTLANPTNLTIGQSGLVIIRQDAVGSRTLTFGSYWKRSVGGLTLTNTANAIDVMSYYVEAADTIFASISADYS